MDCGCSLIFGFLRLECLGLRGEEGQPCSTGPSRSLASQPRLASPRLPSPRFALPRLAAFWCPSLSLFGGLDDFALSCLEPFLAVFGGKTGSNIYGRAFRLSYTRVGAARALFNRSWSRRGEQHDMAASTALLLRCTSFLLLVVLVISNSAGASAVESSSEVETLLLFKNHCLTSASRSALSSWTEHDQSPCTWRGVRCDSPSGKVNALTLDGLGLSGRICAQLADLNGLTILSLSRNNFSGSLPDAITRMPSLRKLNASFNALSGLIPSSFASSGAGSLEHLDLSVNGIAGHIPREIFSSNRNLRTVALAGNRFRGEIPKSMYTCVLLKRVNVSGNEISGSLSEHMGHLRNLQVLDLSWNGVTGGIPLGISFLRNLIQLRLQGNNLTGQIPRGLSACARLQVLDLSFNDLSGSLPSQLRSLTALKFLNLGNNYLSGTIPAWTGRLASLEVLDLAHNMFSGSLPSSLGLLRRLRKLLLSRNSLTGSIPDNLSCLIQLSVVDLSHNQFTLSIPDRLITDNLQFLHLSHNLLSGAIPLRQQQCRSLQVLDLSTNMLTGELPADIASCSALKSLNVSGNSLWGSLPIGMGNLTSLNVLDTSWNLITGSIPKDLCHHSSRLVSLRAHNNRHSGSIPVELKRCVLLERLSLSWNVLDGAIPPELANLARLTSLDLSHNHLSGSIPSQLAHLRSLVTLNVSNNLLHGSIPTGGVFRYTNVTAFAGNPGLCSRALNVTCAPPTWLRFPPPRSPHKPQIWVQPSNSGTSDGRRVLLSVSAIIAISAAACIAVGAVLVAGGSFRARKGVRCNTIRTGSMHVQDRGSRLLAVGKLTMFNSKKGWFGSGRVRSSWLPNEYLLLHEDGELGQGGFGVVYQAVLPDGQTVAVKRLATSGSSAKSRNEFERGMRTLGKVRHPSLIQLEGFYWTEQVQLLLYAFAPCGDLGSRLHERRSGQPILDWSTRFKIAKGTASGLAHLHRLKPQIIHYNLKASNILLDIGNTPKISDFGLFNLVPVLDTFSRSSNFHNSLGYRAPEFASDVFQITEKSDVYAFGVVLLELVTGRRPVAYVDDNEVLVLCDFVRSMLDQSQGLACVDADLNVLNASLLLPFLKLGVICTSAIPTQRPSMAEVVDMLELMAFNSS